MNASSAGNWIEDFLAPGPRFRASPFWGWNDDLDSEELRRQIRDMADHGLGGFYIHSREGLETPYLGQRWMDAVRHAVDEAKSVGLNVWIYDEDRWPSGFAGGKVPGRGDAFRAKGLTLELGAEEVPPDALAAYAVEVGSGDAALSLRRLSVEPTTEAKLRRGEVHAILRSEISGKSDWFNGEAPPDNLNPDCVDAFLAETHEAYFRTVGIEFGATVKGFFFDEPGVHDRHAAMTPGRGWIPWTDGFASFFEERRGYDFFDVAPFIFFNSPESTAARHDYWRTLAERFRETFTRRVGAWCREHGVLSSGHLLWEGDLGVATRVCGSIMPNYYEMDLPGIDILGISDQEIATIKQCASVVNQFGKVGVVSEMYGTSGWNLSFMDQKRHGDWQTALGVTLRCQHHALYSIRGCRKRDYPPSFNYQSCWWRELRVVEDYFARINAALSGSVPVRDILIIHPACTAWSRIGSSPGGFSRRGLDRDLPAARQFGERFNALLRFLVEEKRDCDIGDEFLMGEHGSVDTSESPALRVGRAKYRVVILPQLDTILPETFALLRSFSGLGGAVIVLGSPPSMVEARVSAEAEGFFFGPSVRRVSDFHELAAAIDAAHPRQLDILKDDGSRAKDVWSYLGDRGGESVLFVSNRADEGWCRAEIRVARRGDVVELDPLTGRAKAVNATYGANGERIIKTLLGPSASALFVFSGPQSGTASILRRGLSIVAEPEGSLSMELNRRIIQLPDIGRISPSMPNALILDRARYKVESGSWSEELPLWRAQDRGRAELGLDPIAASEGQQRYLWVGEKGSKDGTEVSFLFNFDVAEPPRGDIHLALEGRSDVCRILLNGEVASLECDGFYLDRSMVISPLPPPKRGLNELEIVFAYRNATEVEDCAIVGPFSVGPDRKIRLPAENLLLGDWRAQGFFHYPGSLVYHFEARLTPRPGERYSLDVGAFHGTTAVVLVNGERIGAQPWPLAEPLDVTSGLVQGINSVDIEIFGGARNFLGPFHCAEEENQTVNWMKFRSADADYDHSYATVPCGLVGPARIFVDETPSTQAR